jgi:hypothetical protein
MSLATVLLSVVLTPLPAPDFKAAPVKTLTAKAPVTLRLVSSGATSITDTDAWSTSTSCR